VKGQCRGAGYCSVIRLVILQNVKKEQTNKHVNRVAPECSTVISKESVGLGSIT
jgi:hypothetical protein